MREAARAFIAQQGLSPANCHLQRSGNRYVLVTYLPDGQELDWFDERVQEETWRQLVAAGVEVRG